MLKLDRIEFAHPGQPRPYCFDLACEPGTITALTGPSGAGKSTLLDLIAGFLLPRSGTILLDECNLAARPPENRPVSIMFQADNLFEHLSVARNLSLGLPRGATDSRKKIASALHQVGLADLSGRRASDISGGQKQRVGLARALLRNQPILLLDEPFANLDRKTATPIRDLVKHLTRQNRWHTLVASHSNTDSTTLADQTYVIPAP